VGGVDRTRVCPGVLRNVRARIQSGLDRGHAEEMGHAGPDASGLRGQGAALSRAMRFISRGLRDGRGGARPSPRTVYSRLFAHLRDLPRDQYRQRVDAGEHLQSGGAAAGAPAGTHHFQPHRAAALAGCRLPGRVLCEDGNRPAGRRVAFYADLVGRPCGHLAGIHCLHRHVFGDLLRGAKTGSGAAVRGDARRGRGGVPLPLSCCMRS